MEAIRRSEEDVIELMKQLFSCKDVRVYGYQNNLGSIHIDTYELIEITFADLLKISQFLGTDAIDFRCEKDSPGCDTCGHGASYSATFQLRKVDIY